MGNANKKEQLPGKSENDMKINHQKFGNFLYHQQEDLIEINLEAESEKDIFRWEQDLKRISSFPDKETLLLPKKHQFKNKGFCGNMGSLKVFYQNYPYLFEEEIENRIEMGKHFQEEQLWYLLYSLCSSARDFSRIDSKIGDVRPYNIFINEEGQLKIANIYSWPYQRTNFDKTAFSKELTYLSPEEMRLISKGNHQNTTNKITSESFSIGLTLLESGLLFNAKQLYSIDHYSIDMQKLNNRLGEWMNSKFRTENSSQGYSKLLKQIVAGMCHPNDRERLRSLQVEEALKPYQNQILNLKEFKIQEVQLPFSQQFFQQLIPYPNKLLPTQPYLNPKQQQSQFHAPRVVAPKQALPIFSQPKVNFSSIPQTNQVRFTQGQNINFGGDQNMKTQFVRYAVHQGQPYPRPISVPLQSYQYQFSKYSSLNQDGYVPSNIIIPPPTNTTFTHQIQRHNFAIPRPNTLNQPTTIVENINSTTTSKFQSLINYQPSPNNFSSTYSRPVTMEASKINSIPVNDGSDFLRKIDEQLEASRRQFPS